MSVPYEERYGTVMWPPPFPWKTYRSRRPNYLAARLRQILEAVDAEKAKEGAGN